MKFTYHSGIYTLETEQLLTGKTDLVWPFFSNPSNLPLLVPKQMRFHITSPPQSHTYPGQIITYSLWPFPFIRTNWVTEITRVHAGYYFVDEQRFGPYAMWHHEHFFDSVEGGILMRDKVTLKMRYGLMGRLFFRLFVHRKLIAIFTHRAQKAHSIFSN